MQLLKALPNLRLLLILGLLFIGPNIEAQTDGAGSDAPANSIPNNIQAKKNQIEEEHDTKNLDKLLIDYNKDSEKVLKDAAKIIQKDEGSDVSNKELGINHGGDPDEQPALKKADLSMFDFNKKKQIDPKALKKLKYSQVLRVTLEPLQKMDEKELILLLKDNTKDSPSGVYIDRFPKLAMFAVRLIKDKEALPSLAKIIDDQDKLIHFSGIMLATILIAFFLKRLMKKEGRSIVKALGLWFLRFLIISSLRIGILLYFFSAEVEPTFNIASKTFF
ncbi:MAG: hypothetical protein H7281_01900 [Bacteriovorax sp.]|nr:hypothetical protein [Bacteriovorax sp.]